MEEQGGWSDADMTALDEEIKGIVEDAWNFADESPEPPLEALWEDVVVSDEAGVGSGVSGAGQSGS
jgi:pyruvate dehydrogenase E1 component alpha subunit